MNDSKKTKTRFGELGQAVWGVMALWTAVIATSLTWNIVVARQETLETARVQARVAYEKDIIYRRWNTGHGGVYVPVSKGTESNPYLSDIPERDITTPSGKLLTLMNPAYMTRQVYELAEEEYGVLGHITSLNPIRPQNAADPWETKALQAFEQGETEISSVEEMEDEEYMRLMRPLITEKGCLTCHAAYGSQEGDIRGGISVSIPMEPLWAIAHGCMLRLMFGHGLLWLIGFVAIVLGAQRLTRSEQKRSDAEVSLKKALDEIEKQVGNRTAELEKEIEARKQVEEALKENEERYHNLFEHISSGVAVYETIRDGEDFIFKDFNNAAEKIDKISKEHLIGKPVTEVFPGVREFGLFQVFQRVWKTGTPERYPVSIYKDKRIAGWRENYVYRLPSGEIVAVYDDLTEEKQAEEALRISEGMLSETQRLSKAGGWEYNVDTKRITWTDEVYNIYGVSPDEYDPNIISQNIEFYALEEKSKIEQAFWKAVNEGESYDLELKFHNARGEELWVRTIGKAEFKDSRVVRVFGNIMDITEHKRTEEALQDSRYMLQTVLDTTPSGIFWKDRDLFYIGANKTWLNSVGLNSSEEVVGKSDHELPWTKEQADSFQENDRKVMESGIPEYDIIEPYLKADGIQGWAKTNKIPLRDSVGNIIGILGSYEDITERKKAEEELKKYRDQLEEMVKEKTKDLMDSRQDLVSLVEDLNEANDQLTKANIKLQELDQLKSMFIASMSHELRTPLNSIIGFTGIILQGMAGEITEEQRKQLSIVKSSGSHLLALINDVIDVSKTEAGKVDLFIEEFDLCAVLQEVKDSFAVAAERKGLELSLTMPEKLIIKTDERRFKQIIMNLVSNAVKFTDKGTVRMIADCGLRIAESKEKEKSEIKVVVSDTGIGIKEEDMDKLFKAFSRIPTEGALQEGTGLGLYLSHKLSNLLGGEIEVESEFGKGSVFTLTLPTISD